MSAASSAAAPVVLITGAAQRIGAAIARRLHAAGYRLLIHYRQSAPAARALTAQLNQRRPDSACALPADLGDRAQTQALAQQALAQWGRVDVLINNASSFYPTALSDIDNADIQQLLGSNFLGPLWLSQALADSLRRQRGCIINMLDIYAERPLAGHSVYCAAKAALGSLTRSLALELAPEVRVNAIAPGAILWPQTDTGVEAAERQRRIVQQIALQRLGSPDDISAAAQFLIEQASYISGQVLHIDGGRQLGSLSGASA